MAANGNIDLSSFSGSGGLTGTPSLTAKIAGAIFQMQPIRLMILPMKNKKGDA